MSIRDDEAEELWRIVEPVLKAWAEDEVPLEEYPGGLLRPLRSTAHPAQATGAQESSPAGDDPRSG